MAYRTGIIQILTFISISLPLSNSNPVFFNFGDSNSDTGNLVSAGIDTTFPPYGQTYFKTPTGRYSDGRLIIDFLMDSLRLPYLNANLYSVGLPSFKTGCNFAASGATILPPTSTGNTPFSFDIQVTQFFTFKTRILELLDKDKNFAKYLPTEKDFAKGLYMFDIGQNDLAIAFYSKSFSQVLASIPTMLEELETGIKRLYDQGARNFWIHNTGPFGCLTLYVADFGTDPRNLDERGCVISHNLAAKRFNRQLYALTKKLKGQYSDAKVFYVDIYTIKSQLFSNYAKLGFKHSIRCCCGHGGPPLNFDSELLCGKTEIVNGTSVTAKGCSDSSKYVIWDGIHYTEAANRFVTRKILTGKYSEPAFSYKMPFFLNSTSESSVSYSYKHLPSNCKAS